MGPKLAEILARPGLWVAALAVAAFLMLYWALRGAPPGQSMVDDDETPDAPVAKIRDRAVGLAVAGLLTVFCGAYVAVNIGILWSLPAFAAGYALAIGTVRAHYRYRHDSPTLRRVIGVVDASVTATLLAGVLILGNIYAFKYGERPIDLTRERAYSLESLTVGQLKSLKKPLKFTVFIGQSPRARRQLDRIMQLLELYKAVDPSKISIDVLLSYAEPVKFDELVRRVPDVAVAPGGGVVLEYGEGDVVDRMVVRNSDMFENESPNGFESDPARLKSTFKGEDAITSALIRVRESKRPKIAFLIGHGEPSVHELDRNRAGLGIFRARLEALGAEIVVHNLARDPLPKDTTLAVIVAPKTPFSIDEAERLKAYAKNGGRLLMLLDGRSPTGLEEWLKDAYRIEVGKSVIRDPQYNVRGGRTNLLAPILGDSHHPIVEPLFNRMVQMPSSTPLVVLPPDPKSPPGDEHAIEIILRSSNSAWAPLDPDRPSRAEPDPKDIRGPIALGISVADLPARDAAPGEDGTPRLVVLSSPFAAENPFVATDATNLDLLVNSVNWLRGRPELTGIAARTHIALRLTADQGMRQRLVIIPTILAVGVILGFATSTYLARRS